MVTDCPEYPSGRGALVVGDSDVTEVTNSYGDQLEQVPFARQEAKRIVRILHLAALTGKLATKCEVLKQISKIQLEVYYQCCVLIG